MCHLEPGWTMQLHMAGSPGSPHQSTARATNVHTQERVDRTWHLSPHLAIQKLHGGDDKQVTAAGAAAAPPAGQCGIPHPGPQVQLWTHPVLGPMVFVSEQVEPTRKVQAEWKPPGARTASQQSHPGVGFDQLAPVSLHPGVAGAVRFLQLHRNNPQGTRELGRKALVPVWPFVPATLQWAEPRTAWAFRSWLQAHSQIHELLHFPTAGCAG